MLDFITHGTGVKLASKSDCIPRGKRDISGEQWMFGAFSTADSSFSAIQEMVHEQRGSESGNNQLNSFLKSSGAMDGGSAKGLMQ